MNNGAAGRHDADKVQLFHGNGCRELNRELGISLTVKYNAQFPLANILTV